MTTTTDQPLVNVKDINLVINALRSYRHALPKSALATRYSLVRLENAYKKMLEVIKDINS